MDRPEEATESVNAREQELSASEPSESNVPNEPTKALLRISQDMEQRNSMGRAWKSQRKPNFG